MKICNTNETQRDMKQRRCIRQKNSHLQLSLNQRQNLKRSAVNQNIKISAIKWTFGIYGTIKGNLEGRDIKLSPIFGSLWDLQEDLTDLQILNLKLCSNREDCATCNYLHCIGRGDLIMAFKFIQDREHVGRIHLPIVGREGETEHSETKTRCREDAKKKKKKKQLRANLSKAKCRKIN